MKSIQTTIKDIARILGISPSTVSRALKGHPDISEKTRRAVEELAKSMKYKPNAIALSLRKSKTNIIGIIIPQIIHHFFSSIISGIEDYTSKMGYNIIICQSNESAEREVNNVYTLISSRVDGILISRTKETTDFSHYKSIIESEIPLVFFDRVCPDIVTDRVIIDDAGAAYNATEWLIKTGCKKLAHYKGPENLLITRKRLQGFKDALSKNNLELFENMIIKAENFDEAFSVTEKLISEGNIPDGIFAVNDMSALGAIFALKKHQISVPEQVAVVGFTNENISEYSEPSITTIEQHGYQMGYKAAELLIKRINNENKNEFVTEVIPTKLIIRNSTRNK